MQIDTDRRKRQLRKLKQAAPCPECGRRQVAAELLNTRGYWDALSQLSREFAIAEGPETLIVSTSDRKGGRSAFIKGAINTGQIEKALGIIGRGQPAGTLVDVGAGAGGLAVAAVSRGLFANAIAVEPLPAAFRLLQANAALNGLLDRITCVNAALGPNDKAQLSLGAWGKDPMDQRILLPGDDLEEAFVPKTMTLVDVAPNLTATADLIALDVTGYEGGVLSGANDAISEGVPVLFTFNPVLTSRYGCFDGIAALLAHHGGWYDLDATEPQRQSGGLLSDMYREAVAAQATASVTVLVTAG